MNPFLNRKMTCRVLSTIVTAFFIVKKKALAMQYDSPVVGNCQYFFNLMTPKVMDRWSKAVNILYKTAVYIKVYLIHV